jgi:hypothetical protein
MKQAGQNRGNRLDDEKELSGMSTRLSGIVCLAQFL